VLLDLHSLFSEEEQTQPPVWVPLPRRRTEPQRRRQVVPLAMDATLPAVEAHAVARVRGRSTAFTPLLATVARAALDMDPLNGGWSDELVLLVAAELLLRDDD
jgi:hypothetical protein